MGGAKKGGKNWGLSFSLFQPFNFLYKVGQLSHQLRFSKQSKQSVGFYFSSVEGVDLLPPEVLPKAGLIVPMDLASMQNVNLTIFIGCKSSSYLGFGSQREVDVAGG